MKKTRTCITALILSVMTMLLSSCSALSEFEQLGLSGWLQLGSPLSGVSTKEPQDTATVVPVTTTKAPVTQVTTMPPATDILTSLPIIDPPPSMQKLLEQTDYQDFMGIPTMLSYTGSPSAFTGINSTDILEALNYIESRNNSGATLFNQRDPQELESLLAGEEYFADIIYIPISDAVKYANAGYLSQLNHDILSIDTEGAYYSEVCRKLSPDEYTYFALPSFSTPYENSIVIFCNTDLLVRKTGEDNIIDLVANGKWTFDLMFKYMALAGENLEEGYVVADTGLSKELLTGTLRSCTLTDTSLEIADFITNHFRYSNKNEALASFFEGKTLFYAGTSADLREFSASADSYAILPLPCEDEYQENNPVMYDPSEIYVLAVPKTAVNGNQAMQLLDKVALGARYQFRYEFIESMYAVYIRKDSSIFYTSVSRFDGGVYIEPQKENETEE